MKTSIQRDQNAPSAIWELTLWPENSEDNLLLEAIYKNCRDNAIKINADGRCDCDCSNTCPLRKTGMEMKCNMFELLAKGVAIQLKESAQN